MRCGWLSLHWQLPQAAASAVFGEFAGRDISMEEQTDVLLFSSVLDVTRFLCAHPELSK